MRTNRVVRKSIKRLRSKNRRNKVNRKTKKRTQKRTQKRVKRCKNNRKTKKIKKSYELTGGFGPHMLAAQRRRQGEQQREQEEERARQQEKAILKEKAKSRLEQYRDEEENAEELFKEYRKRIDLLKQDQLMEILYGLKYQPYLSEQVENIIQTSDREKLIEMVFNNVSRLRQVNKKLWNKYFSDSKIIQNYYRGSPVMETSSPTTFQNPLAKQSKFPGD